VVGGGKAPASAVLAYLAVPVWESARLFPSSSQQHSTNQKSCEWFSNTIEVTKTAVMRINQLRRYGRYLLLQIIVIEW